MFTFVNSTAPDYTITANPATGVTISPSNGNVVVAPGTAAATVTITATGKAGTATAGLTATKTFKIV